LIRSGSAMMAETGIRGSSAPNGSWNTIWIERRAARSSGRPWNRTLPALGICKPATTLPSVLLPLPLSPTSASVSPGIIARLTSSTACNCRFAPNQPPPTGKRTLMRSSETSGVMRRP
jgi:hypothetical protein